MINPYASTCPSIRRRTGRGGEDGEGAKKQREHGQRGHIRTLHIFSLTHPHLPQDLTKSHVPHLVNVSIKDTLHFTEIEE